MKKILLLVILFSAGFCQGQRTYTIIETGTCALMSGRYFERIKFERPRQITGTVEVYKDSVVIYGDYQVHRIKLTESITDVYTSKDYNLWKGESYYATGKYSGEVRFALEILDDSRCIFYVMSYPGSANGPYYVCKRQ